jgi:hypothetical protein
VTLNSVPMVLPDMRCLFEIKLKQVYHAATRRQAD